jgi:cytochrome P450 family 6
VLTAQAIAFFADGFETSSTALGFAIFEIAMNSDVQDKLREEVDSTLEKFDGKLCYEALQEMHYMDRVLAGKLIKFASTVKKNKLLNQKHCGCTHRPWP